MKRERWRQIDELFHSVAQRAPQERAAFLEEACCGDESLRLEVETLLAADAAAKDMVTAALPARVAAALLDQRAPRLAPGEQFNHYHIITLLGMGGMGEVYLAEDTRLKRKVALKLLPVQFICDADRLRRFEQEALAVSALNHPNIITLYDTGQYENYYFIVNEFVDGQNLREHFRQCGTLPIDEALALAQQIAEALAAAHTAGVIHRDIKPENVMLRFDGYIKVLDFGLAKLSDQFGEIRNVGISNEPRTNESNPSNITAAGALLGTIQYMSPEQAQGGQVDALTDIFSLGVVIYEMLTGRTPFSGATANEMLTAILETDPEPLAQHAPQASEALQQLVARALLKDRAKRLPSADEFVVCLRELAEELQFNARLLRAHDAAADESPFQPLTLALKNLPETKYAKSGDVNIAYQVIGNGPLDFVFVMGWVSHLDYFWAESSFARFLKRLASFSRLILFDKRGTGLSDRVPITELPSLEQRMDDVRAVMEAVGSKRAVLCGVSEGGTMCSLFAATYPEKTSALVMIGAYARRIRTPDYPWAPTVEEREQFFEDTRLGWGGPVGLAERAPSMVGDAHFSEWWGTYLRMGASPGAVLALIRMNAEFDVRQVLPSIRVPTLIIHRTGDRCVKVEEGRYLASRITGARFVEQPGIDHLPFVGDQTVILDEIENFLREIRYSPKPDRILTTVLCLQFTISPQSVSSLSCKQELIDKYQAHVRKEIEMFCGREIEIGEETVLASFDGPMRAIRCARALNPGSQAFGIVVRVGIYTGECDLIDDKVNGLALSICYQIAAQATTGEILISSTAKDLIAGSELDFKDRRICILPGISGEWRLLSVEP